MPTIEVDESDQVFIVKGRGAGVRGGYHELGANDLLVVVQQVTMEDARDDAEVVPYSRIYVGGTLVPLIERFSMVVDQELGPPPRVEFVFTDSWPTSTVVELVRRLGDYVTVQVGNNESVVPLGPGEEAYTGPRVSRYAREPVI